MVLNAILFPLIMVIRLTKLCGTTRKLRKDLEYLFVYYSCVKVL